MWTMPKRVILIVSVGTGHIEARKKNVDSIEAAISNIWDSLPLKRAFTSKTAIDKLKKINESDLYSFDESMSEIIREGHDEVIIQPTHMINGIEFKRIILSALNYKEKFKKILIGRPLLTSRIDYIEVIEALDKEYSLKSEIPAIFMGHGSILNNNASYQYLNHLFKEKGFEDVYVETLNGNSGFYIVADNLAKKNHYNIKLLPLMIATGKHVLEDIAGDNKKSQKSVLEGMGFKVEFSVKGLGEINGIQNIFISHVKSAMDGNEIII